MVIENASLSADNLIFYYAFHRYWKSQNAKNNKVYLPPPPLQIDANKLNYQ